MCAPPPPPPIGGGPPPPGGPPAAPPFGLAPPLPGKPAAPKKYVAPKERKAPVKSAYPLKTFPEFSFEYWFNYFYDEVSSPAQQLRFFLEVSPSENVYLPGSQIPDLKKKQLLEEMLNIGFMAYPTASRLSADEMFESMRSKAGPPAKAGYDLQDQGVRVVFRGDGRTPDLIQRVDGTKPQTRVDPLKASRNFDKAWHPWNDVNRANRVYFRKGPNQDNCLFSAISVTPNFEVATKFPLLNELRSTNPAALGTAFVEVTDRKAAAPGRGPQAHVTTLKQKFEGTKLLCSRTNIYVVKMKGGWNTEAYQADAFPERAFENLRWVHHYAILKVIRVHYSDDMNEGHLIVVEDLEWLQPVADLKRQLGDAPLATLQKYLSKIQNQGRLAGGIGGIHYVPPGVEPPLKVKKVERFVWG
jgi:hypothetical protein